MEESSKFTAIGGDNRRDAGDADAGNDNVVPTVTSFGIDENCAAGGGGYRLDQTDDLNFLATFGLTP